MNKIWSSAAALLAALALQSWAQTSPTQLTGTLSSAGSPGGPSVQATFSCSGAPTCVGTYSAQVRDEGCSNTYTLSDRVTMTGLNLGQSGLLSGTLIVDGAGYNDMQHSNGTCSIRPGTQHALTFNWQGQWNATAGTGTFTFPPSLNPGLDLSFSGTFKADTAPPPVFEMKVKSNIDTMQATATADIVFRPQDVGTQGSVYVFALAPAARVQGGTSSDVMKVGVASGGAKDDVPVSCVLAQLNSAGQMVAVTAANLTAYVTGVLSAAGASVSILNGVPIATVSGATFFVGYGPNATTMINTGINRAAVSIPGSLACNPQPPQTGWWWNPLEDGRGFSLEMRGNNFFFASFLYDVSGRSTWYVSSGPISLNGSYYTGTLYGARGGQTLGGAYTNGPTLTDAGNVTIAFNNAATGTLVWPGGTVPIQRFNIVPNGLTLPAVAGQPENGWWWNEQESGRGFFMEWQNGTLDIAGYMYDDAGNSVWYLTVGNIGGTEAARTFTGTWWSYGNGQTLTGAWRQNARINANVAPVTITFSSAETAIMTLPNGRTTNLRRHRF